MISKAVLIVNFLRAEMDTDEFAIGFCLLKINKWGLTTSIKTGTLLFVRIFLQNKVCFSKKISLKQLFRFVDLLLTFSFLEKI